MQHQDDGTLLEWAVFIVIVMVVFFGVAAIARASTPQRGDLTGLVFSCVSFSDAERVVDALADSGRAIMEAESVPTCEAHEAPYTEVALLQRVKLVPMVNRLYVLAIYLAVTRQGERVYTWFRLERAALEAEAY